MSPVLRLKLELPCYARPPLMVASQLLPKARAHAALSIPWGITTSGFLIPGIKGPFSTPCRDLGCKSMCCTPVSATYWLFDQRIQTRNPQISAACPLVNEHKSINIKSGLHLHCARRDLDKNINNLTTAFGV